MGKKTEIEWCDATFNPWIGCTKVSPGCDNCFAEATATRYGWVKKWGDDYHRTTPENWKNPLRWAKEAVAAGKIMRLFCLSLGDIFDRKIPNEWRSMLWTLILKTSSIGGVEWLLLTKRPEYIEAMVPPILLCNPPSFLRFGFTAENQEMYEKRAPIFFSAWHGKNFMSYEPAIGELIMRSYCPGCGKLLNGSLSKTCGTCHGETKNIDWLVAGSESGARRRLANSQWFRIARDQCKDAGIPFMLKQANTAHGALVKRPLLDGRQWLEFPKAG